MISAQPAYFVPRGRGADNVRTPAARIVRQLGGPAAVAALAGVKPKTVYRWLSKPARGGTGGRVPAAAQDKLVAASGGRLAHVDFALRPGEGFE